LANSASYPSEVVDEILVCFAGVKMELIYMCLSARLSHRSSVCLSVRLSHGWISQKRCKLGSPNLHPRLPGRL